MTTLPEDLPLTRAELIKFRTNLLRMLRATNKALDPSDLRATPRQARAPVPLATCQEAVIRLLRKRGSARPNDIQRSVSRFKTPEIRQAMQELVDSGRAEWIDFEYAVVQLTDGADHSHY